MATTVTTDETPEGGRAPATLEGVVERLTYVNPENGYTVAKVRPNGHGGAMSKALTLHIPEVLYRHLQRRANETHRTVADEALAAMAMTLPTADDLPGPIARELVALADLADDQLWQAAQRTMTRRDERRLRALTRDRAARPLTIAEEQELDWLLDRLEDIGLIRARAAALLKERGHDVSTLLPRG